ncbi:MarR family winged helix-turn-helix transcriptional regulator [Streptomyces sp. NPDC049040]|uniref:MarR family winged helix-turn-helix transcriptional regulator n=1 Tax=Streptomyces sp. NPDC049040 TaxID=3365593 RepID=UPI00371037A1
MGLVPDDLACFAVHVAARELDSAYRRELRPLGLTYPQYLTMLLLWDRDGRSVKELGAALRFDSGTLSPLLKRLEGSGLLTRERSQADERSVLIHLTAEGRRLQERGEHVVDRVFGGLDFSVADAERLHDGLRHLITALGAAADPPDQAAGRADTRATE